MMTYESIIDLVKESAGEKLEPNRANKLGARDIAIAAERMNGGNLSFAHITVMINAGALIFVGPDTKWKFGVYKNGDGFYYNDISIGRHNNRKPSFIKTELELKELLIKDGFYVEKEPERKPVRVEVSSVESIEKFDEMIVTPPSVKEGFQKWVDSIPCDISPSKGESVISVLKSEALTPHVTSSTIIHVDLASKGDA